MLWRFTMFGLCAGLASAQSLNSPDDTDLGEVIARGYRDRYGVVDMPLARGYFERVAAEAARALGLERPCCRIEVLRGYAGAPPWPQAGVDGRIYVPIKSILREQDERAFAFRMTHAVAHVLQDSIPDALDAEGLAPIRVSLHGIWCGKPEAAPGDMRAEYQGRERSADEAASVAVKAIALGTGEFEELRKRLSLPEPPIPPP